MVATGFFLFLLGTHSLVGKQYDGSPPKPTELCYTLCNIRCSAIHFWNAIRHHITMSTLTLLMCLSHQHDSRAEREKNAINKIKTKCVWSVASFTDCSVDSHI